MALTAKPARDRYDRPLVIPVGGGAPIPYQRCTTFIDVLDDKTGLVKWGERQVALGMARRPSLVVRALAADPSIPEEFKAELGRVAKDAHEAAASYEKASMGTALHAMTERHDSGRLSAAEFMALPASVRADMQAYVDAMKDFTISDIETFVVDDARQVGGTFDRVVELDGVRYVADIKTGDISYAIPKIAMQLAVYAGSQRYDVATGGRADLNVSQDRGLLIHLPAGDGFCQLHWLDLNAGRIGVALAEQVKQWRQRRPMSFVCPDSSR